MSTKDRGFASLSKAARQVVASIGGRTAHEQGRAHEWNSKAAREQGRKGGRASAAAKAKAKAAKP